MTLFSKTLSDNSRDILDLCDTISMDLLIAENQTNILSNEETLEIHSGETIQTAIYALGRDLALIRKKFDEVHTELMSIKPTGRG